MRINYITQQVIIKTTYGEIQCKLPTNNYTPTSDPHRSGDMGALGKPNTQSAPVQLTNSQQQCFCGSSCRLQYFEGSSSRRQWWIPPCRLSVGKHFRTVVGEWAESAKISADQTQPETGNPPLDLFTLFDRQLFYELYQLSESL